MSTSSVQLQAALPRLKLFGRGKVRDIYAVGDQLLIVATDRISAFDFILGSGIPLKGKVLTQISLFWFEMMKDIIPNHLISASTSEYPAELSEYAPLLEGRSMLVKKGPALSGGVRRARLSGRLRMERIPAANLGVWHRSAEGPGGVFSIAGANLHAGHQSKQRARREYFVRANEPTRGQRHGSNGCGRPRSASIAKHLLMPRRGELSLPTPSWSLECMKVRSSLSMKYSHLTLRGSGRPTDMRRVGLRIHSTSSLFETTWKQADGTNNHQHQHCQTAW